LLPKKTADNRENSGFFGFFLRQPLQIRRFSEALIANACPAGG
jgi:hypothetical protein